MKEFKEFVRLGIVKRQTPNNERAASLTIEAEDKRKFLDISLKAIPPEKMNANFIVDQCYDIIMEMIRAKMFIDGYNSDNSHEAEVSYMKYLGFADAEVRFMDEIRYYRNGIKYYGTKMDMDYAKSVLNFMDKIYPKLRVILVK